MKFQIPFTFSETTKLSKRASFLKRFIKHKKSSKLQEYLNNSDTGMTREDYLSICIHKFIINFVVLYIISTTVLVLNRINYSYLIALGITLIICIFVLSSQLAYPKLYSSRKEREIDRNLIPALEDILIQLNSGVPLFTIMVNISSSNYGALSDEFRKAVKKINAGFPQVEVLEEIGEKSSSIFFRRTLWQISNAMRAGSDLAIVIKDNMKTLNEEQLIQIQNYGNKLNPLIMFYMLVSVILPALSITFLTVISSLVSLPGIMTNIIFTALFFFVVIIQFMFIGLIKSARPKLL